MLAGRSAAKILARDQNACALVPRLIQHEVSILLSVRAKPPVIKHKLAKACALNPLQKLFGDDLVSIHVDPVQRGHAAPLQGDGFIRWTFLSAGWCWEGHE